MGFLRDMFGGSKPGTVSPYAYETPAQQRRRTDLTQNVAGREAGLGTIDEEKFGRRFDPAMQRLTEGYGKRIRGFDELMAERGLAPQGSLAGGDRSVQYSSPFGYGRGEIEGQYAEEAGNIMKEAQALSEQQQLQEYLALLQGYGGATVSPGETLSAQTAMEALRAKMREGGLDRAAGFMGQMGGGLATGMGMTL